MTITATVPLLYWGESYAGSLFGDEPFYFEEKNRKHVLCQSVIQEKSGVSVKAGYVSVKKNLEISFLFLFFLDFLNSYLGESILWQVRYSQRR